MEDFNVSAKLIEEQWSQLQNNKKAVTKKKFEFNEKNYLNLRLNNGETSRQVKIRILPVSSTNGNAFMMLHTHSIKVSSEIAKSGFKSFICLDEPLLEVNDERGCPLCNKYKELSKEASTKTDQAEWKALNRQANQYKAKETYIVRVIERGHEDEGVKFWRFNAHYDGNGFYDKLLSLYKVRKNESLDATGEEYNIFDLQRGKDIIITLTKDPTTDKTSAAITDAGFESPLSKDPEQIKSWVNDEKKWNDMYSSKNYDYLKLIADGEIPYFDKIEGVWVAKKAKENEAVETPEQIENSISQPDNRGLAIGYTYATVDELPF